MPARRTPWWLFLAAGTFVGYFALVVYCDFVRPEHRGLRAEFDDGRMRVVEVAGGSPADAAGLRPGDVIRTWDGQPIRVRRDWVAVEANAEIGRSIALGIEREGRPRLLTLLTPPAGWSSSWSSFALAVIRLVQGVTLGLGLFLVFKRPGRLVTVLGGWVLASAGVFIVVLPYRIAALWRELPWPAGALLWLPHASSLVVMAGLLTFFLVFPVRRLRSARGWALIWVPAMAAAAGPVFHTWLAVYRPGQATGRGDWTLALLLLTFAWAVAAVLVLWRNYRQVQVATDRRRVLVLLAGTAIGLGAGFTVMLSYWYFSPHLELLASPSLIFLTLTLLAVPLSFTYAILGHRLFDVRIIVRQGLRYAAARGLLLSVAPLLSAGGALDLFVHRGETMSSLLAARGWTYVMLGAGALVAHRERRRLLDALDRRFFRERYDAARVLRRVAMNLRGAGGLATAAETVTRQVEGALHTEFAALLVAHPGDRRFHAVAFAGEMSPLDLPADAAAVRLARSLGKPVVVAPGSRSWLRGALPEDEASALSRSRVEMLVPVALDPGRSRALLALGAKRSEEPFSIEDKELLAAIAASLALVVDPSEQEPAGSEPSASPLEQACLECPRCGKCWPAGLEVCADDHEPLLPLALPHLLAGRYRLVRRLGLGGMSIVYEARDEALERGVAVKVLRDDRLGDEGAAARFRQEARVAATFAHPNVVTVHDFGVVGRDRGYLVMEMLEGTPLSDELRRRGRFEPPEALDILRGVAAAVEAAHARQIVHRDLKPGNIWLAPAGKAWLPKVLDFGIARMLAEGEGLAVDAFETTGSFLAGTLPYMSPEQLRGERPSPTWDLWALSVVAFEMLTGRHPFAGLPVVTAPRAGGPGDRALAPLALVKMFDRLLSPDPVDRPASAPALIAALEGALAQAR